MHAEHGPGQEMPQMDEKKWAEATKPGVPNPLQYKAYGMLHEPIATRRSRCAKDAERDPKL